MCIREEKKKKGSMLAVGQRLLVIDGVGGVVPVWDEFGGLGAGGRMGESRGATVSD